MTTWILLRRVAVLMALAMLVSACNGEVDDVVDDVVDDDEPTVEEEIDDDDVEVDEEARGDGQLRLGYLLPETGQLQFLGPPMIAATELAVQDINEAGGVLGQDVQLSSGDEAGDAAVASESVQRLLGEGVDAVIGAAASGMSLAVIDAVTGAEVVQCSPSNTSPTFTDYDDGGYYFRAAPTDALQGPVLAETIIADGHTNVAILARADDYGQGLADVTQNAIAEAGGEVAEMVIYDPEAATFDSEIQQVAGAGPDAVAIIAFDEGAQLLQGLIEQGMGPGDFPVYAAEALRSAELPELVEPGNPNVLDGMIGTAPVSRADEDWADRLESENPELTDTLFAGEAYDCVMVVALAAVAAGSDDPRDFVNEMIDVTRDGTECTTFEECAGLLEDGEDINYNGVSGPLEFTEVGEPSRGVYEIWEFTDGEIVTLDEQESTLE